MNENLSGSSNKKDIIEENSEIELAEGVKYSQKQNLDQEKPKNDNGASETEKNPILKDAYQDDNLNQKTVKTNKPRSKKKLLIVLILIVVLVLGAVGVFVFKNKKLKPKSNTPVAENAQTQNTQEQKSENTNLNELQDVKFNDQIQEIEFQPVFTSEAIKKYSDARDIGDITSSFKFYKVGTAKKGELIVARIPAEFEDTYTLILKQDNKYTLLLKHSTTVDASGSYFGPEYDGGTKLDSDTFIPVLEVKDTISYNGITASLVPYSKPRFLIPSSDQKQTEEAKIDQGVVYEQVYENPNHPGVKQFSILLKQPTGLYLVYRYTTDVLKDDNSVTINYKDGNTSTEKYTWAMVRGGCGVVDSVNVVDKAYFNDLTEIGKAGNEPIYGFKSANHQVVNTIYEAYNYDGAREGAVSKEQFWKDNGVVVVRNKLGYRVVLVNEKYQAQGECGKPVIYLYPQQKTDVKVKVGADITVSDPAYDMGWDVTASPDGQIFNKKDGKTYPYLFWEGQGHGLYPNITEGFVVKRSEAEKTMWAHLAKLGLNQQESKDFMDFWEPKLPNKPYVRLTWFGTSQMDKLAPLELSVKPDTTIRVFLDFKGLDKPYNLKPQKLTHKPRNGFTLVEWGGLLYK